MVRDFLLQLIYLASSLLWILPPLLVLELLLPIGKPGNRLKGLSLWSVYVVLTSVVLALDARIMQAIGVRSLFRLDLSGASAWSLVPLAAAASIFAAMLGDFLYYWFHRAQHRFPLLWRFHAVHHSIRHMNVTNGYPHWIEEFAKLPFVTIPVALLMPDGVALIPWIGIVFMGQSFYIHSATRFNYGPLNWLLCSNRFHRLHHSIKPQHYDRNFGVVTPIWDVLFGTAIFPGREEWPETGIVGYPEMDGALDFVTRPFRSNRRRSSVLSEQEVASPKTPAA